MGVMDAPKFPSDLKIVFVVSPEKFAAFEDALDSEPAPDPKLAALMSEPVPWDTGG